MGRRREVMGYRISKSEEQVRAEATAAAAEELRQVMQVIEVAGMTEAVQGPAGYASLISTAAHLYEKHTSLIEADSLELVDDPETGPSSLFGEPGLTGPMLGRMLGRPPLRGSPRPNYLHIAQEAEAELRAAQRRQVEADYPEPDPTPPEGLPLAICLRCAKPIGDHVDNTCP